MLADHSTRHRGTDAITASGFVDRGHLADLFHVDDQARRDHTGAQLDQQVGAAGQDAAGAVRRGHQRHRLLDRRRRCIACFRHRLSPVGRLARAQPSVSRAAQQNAGSAWSYEGRSWIGTRARPCRFRPPMPSPPRFGRRWPNRRRIRRACPADVAPERRRLLQRLAAITNFSHTDIADAEIDAARRATDIETQRALWATAQRKLLEQVCVVPLFEALQVWARRATLDYGAPLTRGERVAGGQHAQRLGRDHAFRHRAGPFHPRRFAAP
jgi:hypothetical protein